ncbi:HVO_0234 family beta-propeller protein [Halobellus limi]|uniref:HVO-0234-like beta-propeller domain-containing protein n=1 Tax=Halobellus limi TaxID=699433 RepID=A0A1H5W9H7_9EURY|nr:hypothetical protein [Halobellus limi]QCC46505.1 hypothetical protein DV707_01770 [Halobellus limi]SEF96028.1 hypothetical protein SAMN04488133_1204 [Halobellus limi]
MPTIDEKRVYTDNAGTETVYLASGLGVVAVSVSDDLIGEFGIAHRCQARDVATAGRRVAVATDEDVLVADRDVDDEGDSTVSAAEALAFEATGFGPATAVGFDGGAGDTGELVAGDGDGRVARLGAPSEAGGADASETGGWTEIGTTGPVRAIDGGLVAAADGVYRMGSDGVTHAGLDDARDVDAEPLVATGTGLYKLGNGWMDVLDGPVDAVDAGGASAQAAVDGRLYVRRAGDAPDAEWREERLPVEEPVAAVAHGVEASYAVTEGGTFAVRLPDGEWRYRGVGVRDVVAAAV